MGEESAPLLSRPGGFLFNIALVTWEYVNQHIELVSSSESGKHLVFTLEYALDQHAVIPTYNRRDLFKPDG